MGKRTEAKSKEGDTKVLYKKSNNTVCTQSKSCSGASQLCTRSGILQIKKKLSQTNKYYKDGDKIKRDLSIETDICILRRYYKSKKNKYSNPEALSVKSKFSTLNDNEEDLRPDTSASGDNEQRTDSESIVNKNLDVTSLVMNQLKTLLNEWIQNLLLDKKQTKLKHETALDSILHRSELRVSSSRSTYILDKKEHIQAVKNKKVATCSIPCPYCHKKSSTEYSSTISENPSCYSAPFPYKQLRIISTLSIPRNFNKTEVKTASLKKKRTGTWYKIKKVKEKNIIISLNKPSKVLLDSSSFDVLAISTESLMKRCVQYKDCKSEKNKVSLFSKRVCKNATTPNMKKETRKIISNEINTKDLQLDIMPSLVKSIFVDDPANITSTEKGFLYKTDNSTMTDEIAAKFVAKAVSDIHGCETEYQRKENFKKSSVLNEKDQSDPLITIDFVNQSLEFPNFPQNKNNNHDATYSSTNENVKTKLNSRIFIRRRRQKRHFSEKRSAQFTNIRHKTFTYLYKKTNNKFLYGNDFLNHFLSVFKYFANYEGKRNIKLDIQVNVFPMLDNISEEANMETNSEKSSLSNGDPTKNSAIYNLVSETADHSVKKEITKVEVFETQQIIPLLDSALNQDKYIFKDGTSTEKSIKLNNIDAGFSENSNKSNTIEISQEISELRSIIKDLTSTTEKYVSEHYNKFNTHNNQQSEEPIKTAELSTKISNQDLYTKESRITEKLHENTSKGIQFASEFVKNNFYSGVLLKKEPKNADNNEYCSRLMKKSTSYRIIDSESILKVTDMTSTALEGNDQRVIDEALTCSLPRSRSLFEVSTEKNKRKLLAFFCEGAGNRPQNFIYRMSDHSGFLAQSSCNKKRKECQKGKRQRTKTDSCVCSQPSEPAEAYLHCPSSSLCIHMDSNCNSKFNVRTHRPLTFPEGCCYCIIMWVPIITISILFYFFVLKDTFTPKSGSPTLLLRADNNERLIPQNKSNFQLDMSDLGF